MATSFSDISGKILPPHEYEQQFRAELTRGQCATKVVCTHEYHPTETFYLTLEDYQQHFMPLTTRYWCNGYNIVISEHN